MTIKRISLSEVDLVINLFDQYRVFYKKESDMELARKFLTERLTNTESIIYAAMDGDTPTGFTQLYPKYSSARAVRNWILNDLFVTPGYRKQGVGSMLIKAAMDFAREHEAIFVQLETAVDNYTAQALYESIGFVKQGTRYRIPVIQDQRVSFLAK